MKAVILAGGFGTRISEATNLIPKPMVEVGGKPILWHIMKIYSAYGITDFVVCLGYKSYVVKEFFANYFLHNSDVTIDLANNQIETHGSSAEPWKVTLIDTGLNTMTGSRVRKIQDYIGNEPFLLTYGDGVADIDIQAVINQHNAQNNIVTLTAYQPDGRFGSLVINDADQVSAFAEKPKGGGAWVNAGFFVCSPELFDFLGDGDNVILERGPLEKVAALGRMRAYKHEGFWRPMDTLRDNQELNKLWDANEAPWKVW